MTLQGARRPTSKIDEKRVAGKALPRIIAAIVTPHAIPAPRHANENRLEIRATPNRPYVPAIKSTDVIAGL